MRYCSLCVYRRSESHHTTPSRPRLLRSGDGAVLRISTHFRLTVGNTVLILFRRFPHPSSPNPGYASDINSRFLLHLVRRPAMHLRYHRTIFAFGETFAADTSDFCPIDHSFWVDKGFGSFLPVRIFLSGPTAIERGFLIASSPMSPHPTSPHSTFFRNISNAGGLLALLSI